MSFKFHHSLASRAAVSVVTSLWYHEDIDSLRTTYGHVADDIYKKDFQLHYLTRIVQSTMRIQILSLQAKVTDSVSRLPLPNSLKRYLLEFVQIIGENLGDWIENHYSAPQRITDVYGHQCFQERLFNLVILMKRGNYSVYVPSSANGKIDVDLRNVLRWNPDGEIDMEQTGEALVRNESDSIKRFRLAFAYCREDEMLRLWPSVQTHFSNPEAWDCNDSHQICALFWWRYFRHFWPTPIQTYLLVLASIETTSGGRLLVDELGRSCCSPRSCAVNWSPLTIYISNKLQTIHALSDEHLKILLSHENRYMPLYGKPFKPIFFKMPASHQDHMLNEETVLFFIHLLYWRHQTFFMDAVDRSWDAFDNSVFASVLSYIARDVEKYEASDICRRIFLRFWTRSPARLRDVERIFYDRKICSDGTTLRHFALLLFGHSPAAEDRMKRVLFEGRYVLELATGMCVQDVLSDLVRTCLPPEEWGRKLELLSNFFAAVQPQKHQNAAYCRCSTQRV